MNKTKVDIISGFLGAGKTTFIKKLVKDLYLTEKVVILENEFGKINIDEETLRREGIEVKPIQAGCICCSSAMDLSKGINEIISEFNPERIIIEPTGIAKLSDVKKLLLYDEMEQVCEIDHVITIVDAKNYYIRTLISKDFFEDQIRASEIIFLSKTDSMEKDELNQVKEAIDRLHPACLVVDERWDEIPAAKLKELIEYRKQASEIKNKLGMRVNHANDFDRYEIITEDTLNINQITRFMNDLSNGQYGEIHRVKGICRDSEKGLYSVDYIPKEITIKPIPSGQTNTERSIICLIGRQIDKAKIDGLFSCPMV